MHDLFVKISIKFFWVVGLKESSFFGPQILRQHIIDECRQINLQMLQNLRFEQNLYYCIEVSDQHFE